MEEIPLANDVTIEFDPKEVDTGSQYRFTEDVPEIGECAKEGIRFKLKTRKEDPKKEGYLYKFRTEHGVWFRLVESTFSDMLTNGTIVQAEE